jgi:hypothetical protein
LGFHELAVSQTIQLPEPRKHEVCGACGYIAEPRSSSSLAIEKTKSHKAAASSGTKSGADKTLVNECKKCGYNSRSRVAAAPRKLAKRGSTTVQALQSAREVDSTSPSVKQSRKQKQTQRKKQGSLQAMLAKSKSSGAGGKPSSGFGLDLMDLMKSG